MTRLASQISTRDPDDVITATVRRDCCGNPIPGSLEDDDDDGEIEIIFEHEGGVFEPGNLWPLYPL